MSELIYPHRNCPEYLAADIYKPHEHYDELGLLMCMNVFSMRIIKSTLSHKFEFSEIPICDKHDGFAIYDNTPISHDTILQCKFGSKTWAGRRHMLVR